METNINQQTNVKPVAVPQRKTSYSREIPYHLWAFFISMALTAFAFIAVHAGIIENTLLLGMFILLLAAIQVIFQLFVWMHLNQKGHEVPILFIFTGFFVAAITVGALMLLIWW
jgi:cytochrome c oxidase subunit 4